MIKFFRKIRQNLLSEGKTGKYLKYAIGEIVLVVIGILIALQINNWNENRKAIQNEYRLVDKMIEQTVKDSILFSKRIKHSNEHMKEFEHYIAIGQGRADSLGHKKFREYRGYQLLLTTMNDGSYLIRNHSEDFKKINNLELREQLMEYSYLSTMQDKAIEIATFNTLNYNIPITHKYHETLSRFDTTSTFYEMQEFFKNPELESHFDISRASLNNVVIQVELIYSKNKEVLERLKQYRYELGN